MQLPAHVILDRVAALEASTGIRPLEEYKTYVCCNESLAEPHYVPPETLHQHLRKVHGVKHSYEKHDSHKFFYTNLHKSSSSKGLAKAEAAMKNRQRASNHVPLLHRRLTKSIKSRRELIDVKMEQLAQDTGMSIYTPGNESDKRKYQYQQQGSSSAKRQKHRHHKKVVQKNRNITSSSSEEGEIK